MALLALFSVTGSWVFYNTKVLNKLTGPKDQLARQAEYEKSYKQFDTLPEPRVRGDKYSVDIFPETRSMTMRAEEVFYNPYQQPLSEIRYNTDQP